MGEPAWGGRRQVAVVWVVEPDEEVLRVERHHLQQVAVNASSRCDNVSDDRGTDRRPVPSQPDHDREVGEAGRMSVHHRRGDHHHVALHRAQRGIAHARHLYRRDQGRSDGTIRRGRALER